MLYIIRGLPGSGKSTLGNKLAPQHCYAADDYFTNNGVYSFDHTKLSLAHEHCFLKVSDALSRGQTVAVCNTFTTLHEMNKYIQLSFKLGINFLVIDLFNQGYTDEQLSVYNTHGVPKETISRMRRRYEIFMDWKNA
jgi:predicted kinase